jgi:DNA repair exonuclease SbcCD nuclease subunit
MKEQITFIHAADLHLDSPFKGLANVPEEIFTQIQNSTFHALDQLVEAAIQKNVDFVLLAGDLFDNERQSLKAQIHLKKAFEKLEQYHINVYVSYGNHDFVSGNPHPVQYPKNVYVFEEETVGTFPFIKNQHHLANIYGFSYMTREVMENKTEEYVIKNKEVPFHIAMLHGSVGGNDEHDVYAPFERRQLIGKDFDYWALGHIHKRQILHEDFPVIVYPGNIQGRHRKETGDKGCYYVRLTKAESELTFIPLHSILFESLAIDVSDCRDIHQVETILAEQLQSISGEKPQLIDLKLTSAESMIKKWESEQLLEELIDVINDSQIHKPNWQYIFKMTVETQVVTDFTDIQAGDHFFGELLREFEETEITGFLSELYEHRQARRVLDPLSTEEKGKVKTDAKQLLMSELLKGWHG